MGGERDTRPFRRPKRIPWPTAFAMPGQKQFRKNHATDDHVGLPPAAASTQPAARFQGDPPGFPERRDSPSRRKEQAPMKKDSNPYDNLEMLFAFHVSEKARSRRAAYIQQQPEHLRAAEGRGYTLEQAVKEVLAEVAEVALLIKELESWR
jgi:hypothetical protein